MNLSGYTQHFLVVDDHEMVLEGTESALKKKYPDTEILKAQDRQNAQNMVEQYSPDVVLLDLSIPDKPDSPAKAEVGIQFLSTLISSKQAPNIMVLSTNVQPLVLLKALINTYEGGFVAMDKSKPMQEMLRLIDLSVRGSIYLPPQVRSRPQLDPKWVQLLKLKFESGYTDKAIAKRMGISDRTVRNYWTRIGDAWDIFYDRDNDIPSLIGSKARKLGLID